ncbi:MAG: zinc-ribbon domain-containing protein [Myxococcaceae bacterium]
MLISCEKCSTTYVLDEALIPPQGTAVQCTRCGHVFTARITAAAPPPPEPPASRAGNSTMMFGTPAAPPSAAKNQTMMFGTPASNAAAQQPAAPSAPAGSASKTMVFGQGAAPAAPAKNQTMMFGTPASNAAAQQPAPPSAPAGSASKTMVFGQGAAPAAPAAKNQTMMFGTPVSNAASAPPPPAAPVNPKQTMVFGTAASNAGAPAPAAPAANSKQTMMFGTPASNAASAAPPPAAPSAKQTMVFGSGATPPPAQAAKQTMVFGTAASNAASAPPPQQASAARTTIMFGGAQAPAQPPPAASKQTMVFGTAASNASLESSPSDETIMEQPGQSARTLMFGAPTAENPNVGPPPAKNQTMMFGKSPVIPKISAGPTEQAGMSVDENAPGESTVRVDALNEQSAVNVDGGGESEEPSQPVRADRTQRFAMSDLGGTTPPEGRDPVQDRHNRTQLFAMSSAQESTAPLAQPVVEANVVEPLDATMASPSRDLHGAPTIDLTSTLPPDQPLPQLDDTPGVSTLLDPSNQTPMESEAAPADGPIATTLPNLGPVGGQKLPPLNVTLNAEPGGAPVDLSRPIQMSSPSQAAEDAAAMRAARGGGAGRAVVIVLALVALALLGVLVWRLFGEQIMGLINKPPPDEHPVGSLLKALGVGRA